MKVKIAIVGEFYPNFLPQTAINQSLDYLARSMNVSIIYDWIETTELLVNPKKVLSAYHGIWSAPGSPFKSLEGALNAVQFARENNLPHLGTCAGFQHTIIEIARNMLGYPDAHHEEYSSGSSDFFISKLACSLAGKTMKVRIEEGTQAYNCYKSPVVTEDYYCNFAINPQSREKLKHPNLVFSGTDQDGEIRIIELKDKDFFISTLFVPQAKSTPEEPHPLISGFVSAVLKRLQRTR